MMKVHPGTINLPPSNQIKVLLFTAGIAMLPKLSGSLARMYDYYSANPTPEQKTAFHKTVQGEALTLGQVGLFAMGIKTITSFAWQVGVKLVEQQPKTLLIRQLDAFMTVWKHHQLLVAAIIGFISSGLAEMVSRFFVSRSFLNDPSIVGAKGQNGKKDVKDVKDLKDAPVETQQHGHAETMPAVAVEGMDPATTAAMLLRARQVEMARQQRALMMAQNGMTAFPSDATKYANAITAGNTNNWATYNNTAGYGFPATAVSLLTPSTQNPFNTTGVFMNASN